MTPISISEDPILETVEAYARRQLEGREAGHDFFHADRVRRTALRLREVEGGDARVIAIAALLHDVADPKMVPDPEKAQQDLGVFLRGSGISAADADHVLAILAGMSFGKELQGVRAEKTPEFRAVQDADRLDALGAIGIARCFGYGGSRNQPLHDPDLPSRASLDAKGYRTDKTTSLNHFSEKLFLLKDRMNTETARRWAEERHAFLVEFRDRFLREWDGTDFPTGRAP